VILKKDSSNTVYFEFAEENGVKTTRHFEEDLMFAYGIAVEAVYDQSKKDTKIQIVEYDGYAEVKIIE
jgi:hypothetical protein